MVAGSGPGVKQRARKTAIRAIGRRTVLTARYRAPQGPF